jgi:hypothetical protein
MTYLISLQLCSQLLEGIGAISRSDGKKAVARGGNYQDSVTAPVDRVFDDGAAMVDEENEDFEETISMPLNPSENIISAVDKLCIRALSFHLTVLLTSF